MSYNPHRIPAPRTFAEIVEDAIHESHAEVKVLALKKHIQTVVLAGSYADLLLAKKALAKREISVE